MNISGLNILIEKIAKETLIKSTVRPEPDKTTSHSTKHDKAVQVAGYVEGCF
jgi:hypothetical protein